MRATTLRTLRITGLVLMIGLAGLTVAFAATGSFPLTPTHNSSAARAFGLRAGGSLTITNSLEGQAILNATGMRPGDTRVGQVTITNSGNIPGDFTLSDSAITDTGSAIPFSTVAQLLIQDVSNPALPVTLYAGSLGALTPIALGSLAASETRIYRFTVTFPNGTPAHDNALQGAHTTVQYDWAASAPDGSTPTDTTPGGPGGTTPTSPTTTTGPVIGASPDTPIQTDPTIVTPHVIPNGHGPRTTGWKVKLTSKLRRRVRSGRVDYVVSCGQRCHVSFGGTIKIPPLRKRFKVGHVAFWIPAGRKVRVEVRLSSALKAGLIRSLRAHKHPTITVQVKATAPKSAGKLHGKAHRTVRFVK